MDNTLYYSFDSPIGQIGVYFKQPPLRIHFVELGGQGRTDVKQIYFQPDKKPDRISKWFQAYFAKKPIPVDWDMLFSDEFTPLQKAVWKAAMDVKFGCLATYSQIAHAIGRPGAFRFVGNALGKNPFPLFVPCHRIIRSDGGLGGFSGGLDIKRKLLAFEQSLSDRMLAHITRV